MSEIAKMARASEGIFEAPAPCKKLRLAPTTTYLKEYADFFKKFEETMHDKFKAVRIQYMEIDHKVAGIPGSPDPTMDPVQGQEQKEAARQTYFKEMDVIQQAFHQDLKPVIEKIFKEHDTNNNDVLDKEEAATFWDHFVGEEASLVHDLWNMRVKHKIEVDFRLKGIHIITEAKDVARMDERNADQVKEMFEAYKANKADRDAAAFKVMDASGDGTLQLSEFMEVMIPDGEKNKQFLKALGMREFDPN